MKSLLKNQVTLPNLRDIKIERARRYFWNFCELLAPGFYKEHRGHLVELCETLQALYEGRIIKYSKDEPWQMVDEDELDQLQGDYIVCKKLMTNLPPQHGKSRTLINFCEWVLGKNMQERIITCSYNDLTASDFSRYTRDGIQEEKNDPEDIVYNDIFPETRIKQGNSSYQRWALEGEHFNYIGAGVGGSITSKGGSILIVDDPVKGAEEALNDTAMEKIWRWYTGTFFSRVSAEAGEPLEIVNMTRWASKDICGRILESEDVPDWYILKMEAYYPDTGDMLCPEFLGYKRYKFLERTMVPEIFRANYHQEPIDLKGTLYKNLKTYDKKPEFEQIIAYGDTADEGDDYLCVIAAGIKEQEAYILDVYYTKEGMETTEPETASFFIRNRVNSALIESNNGGRGFARNVQRILKEKYKSNMTSIEWFHQTENKMARIITNSSFVINHIYFPEGWNYKFPEFFTAITTFKKEGKNKNDDGPDALSGVGEMISDWSVAADELLA